MPRRMLLLLYCQRQDTLHAQKLAKDILSMPIKIPSEEVTEVKLEAEEILKKSCANVCADCRLQ